MWSTPVEQRAGKSLLVLLHGLGSHEGDLFQLSPYLPLDFVIVSPRGPLRSGNGWSWFDIAAPRPEPLNRSADEFAEWLATVRGDAASVVLLGFSQGGVLALQTLRRHPELVDSLLLLSAIADETVGGKAQAGIKVTPPDGKEFQLYFDKETGLPLRAQLESEASGNVQGVKGARVVAEMRDISTTIDDSLFQVPADFSKVPPEQVRQQIDSFTRTVMALGKLVLSNMNTPAPSPTASPAQ